MKLFFKGKLYIAVKAYFQTKQNCIMPFSGTREYDSFQRNKQHLNDPHTQKSPLVL